MRHPRPIPSLHALLCALAISAVGGHPSAADAGEAAAPTVAPALAVVPLIPFGLLRADTVVGAEGIVLPLNLPLLRRVVLTAGDLRQLTVKLQCRQAEARLDVCAQGRASEGIVDLAGEAGLRRIALRAGHELAICAWKADAHFNATASITGLRIVRIDAEGGAVADALPTAFGADGMAPGVNGSFSCVGIANRDRLPLLRERVPMQAGEKPGTCTVPGSRGSGLTVADGIVRLRSNGRADSNAAYDWAPALVFTAAHAGIYAIEGTLSPAPAKPGQQVAWMIGRLEPQGPPLAGASLKIRLPGAPVMRQPLAVGADGKPAPVIADLGAAGRGWLDATASEAAATVAVVAADGSPVRALLAAKIDAEAHVASRPKALLFEHAVQPRDGVYATMRDGKLYYGDQRLRLWGMVKDGPGERIRRLGFNCVRVWFQDSFYTAESAKLGKAMEYVQGDGSKLDEYDRMMADYRTNGLFIMFATTVGSGTGKIPIELMTADDAWIAGGEDWPAWKAAVTQVKNLDGFAYVDERLWRIRLRHAENVFTHRNPYTGRRYAEEESIALVEVNNEAGLVKRWLERGFDAWPAYFHAKMLAHWNSWLARRYPDDAALRRAWGALDEDEAFGMAKLEPVLANRSRYPRQRQQDLIRFVCEHIDARNQEYRSFCRSLAPAGTGVNTVPFSFDSQYQPGTPWTYGNFLGDTSTVSMYFWRHDSMLASPPGLYVLDSTRTADRLSVIYETQRARPSPCRSEYPYILAAMTGWQDFDVVVWHGSWIGRRPDEALLAGTAPPPLKDHFWSGVHLEHDPAMSAAIAMAGRLYLAGTVGVAPEPAQYALGADAIFSYDVWNGIGGREMSQDTFTRGSRIAFRPDQPGGVSLDGAPLAQRPRQPAPGGPVMTGRYVTWDWQHGRLVIDAPTAKVLVGRTPQSHRFADGITLSGLEGPFTAFSLVSADGKPLAGASRSMLVCSTGDARNTGLDFDFTVPGGPIEQAKAIRNAGHAPVVVDPAGYTIAFPTRIEGAFTGYDFALRETVRSALDGSGALRQPGQTLWMGRLELTASGEACEPVVDPSPGAAAAATVLPSGTESSDPALAEVPHPIPGLSWGDNYQRAHRALRDSPLTKTSVSPVEQGNGVDCTITVVELEGVWGQAADVDIAYQGGRMRRLAVTFRQAPAFADLLVRLRTAHGAAVSERLAAVASDQSEVRWTLPGGVSLLATEVQGMVRMVYELGTQP
jgi:hypothetical protein